MGGGIGGGSGEGGGGLGRCTQAGAGWYEVQTVLTEAEVLLVRGVVKDVDAATGVILHTTLLDDRPIFLGAS